MRYFIDTEFHEYKKKPLFSKGIETIELISIGIVSEDNREYYAISKDFDIKNAWNNEWLRDNVLRLIFKELMEVKGKGKHYLWDIKIEFCYKNLKWLIKKYGKSNEQIADEIFEFVNPKAESNTYAWTKHLNKFRTLAYQNENLEFYGYYSDYDWVVFCWLFGRMIDLPKVFPMMCFDLKQESDRIYNLKKEEYTNGGGKNFINKLSNHLDYPKQTNEHNALSDAQWNYELYKFLKTI